MNLCYPWTRRARGSQNRLHFRNFIPTAINRFLIFFLTLRFPPGVGVSSSGACGLPLVQVVRHIRSLRPRAPKTHALGLGLCLSSLSQTPPVGLGTSASFRSVACALTSSARHHRRHYNHVLKADMEKKTSRKRTSVRSSRSRTSRHRRSAGIACTPPCTTLAACIKKTSSMTPRTRR